ncbi:MAG: hotdog fold thioesterase [Bacteroidota bacterium]
MTKKRIFPENLSIDALNSFGEGCLVAYLGIRFIEAGDNYLKATMPVDHRTKQPMGLLHGGASVALAETMGSVGAALCLDLNKQYAVGLEINANHVKSAKKGLVTGIVSPIHIGKRTHVWSTKIKNDKNQLIAISRITMAILDKK